MQRGWSDRADANPGRRRLRAGEAVAVALLALAGLGLAAPGAYLALLGGSLYYLAAGALVLLGAWLIARRRSSALWLYGTLLLGTLAWSLWEVGLDGWALMPRLVFFFVGGLCLLFLVDRRSIQHRAGALFLTACLTAFVVGTGISLAIAAHQAGGRSAHVASRPPGGDGPGTWSSYGNDHATRYSPLAQITPANARSLHQAWVYRTGLFAPGGKRRGGLELTPVMQDGLLYGCTAFSTIFALDPVTGRQVWRHDAGIKEFAGGHPVCRGVTFFRAPAGTAECPTRVLLGTLDNRLIALDARTGAPCRSFGNGGAVDLLDGIGPFPHGWTHPTSPPTIVNGVAVIGAYVVDNQSTHAPPGVIRGYDAVTGALRWAFDPGRPDEHRPLAPGQTYTPSTPNAWTVFSGDERLNLVYVPMGNGSPDFVGSTRSPETERFSTSLIALDATTGRTRWVFQAVHHDLWDYDLAAQPALVDIPTAHGPVPALIVPTKTGQIFVLDRRTGQPLTRVEERAVPRSIVPGERAASTQPYSTGMPSFPGADLTEADMWGLTPFDQLYCRIRFRQSVYQGPYTPMQRRPTIRFPGELGGIDWGSVSVDEARGLLIVNSNRMADRDQLITRAEADREHLVPKVDPRGHFAPGGAMAGTPYGAHWGPFLSGLGVPCQRPPYGLLTAIDLKTRKVAWSRSIGDARNSGPFGIATHLPIPLGAPNIGGTIATGGGLIFMAATQDEMFRAIDVTSGRIVWQVHLPAAGHATPMTYRGADGTQYVVIAAGGQSLQDRPGDFIIAYRLGR